MKNVLIFTNPKKQFTVENQTLVKIHIDNSLELGWKREDILLFTNFEYEYNGIKAEVIDSETYRCDFTSNKIFVIRDLLRRGLPKDLYWYHDFDAYQNDVITEEELKMDGYDLGVTGYGYKDQANGGSFFFRENTLEFFELWCKNTRAICRVRADEKSLTDLIRGYKGGIMPSWKWLNITYNFGQRCPKLCYEQADKPLKVLHFHPYYKYYPYNGITNIDVFMHGNNRYKIPMMSQQLIKIFQKHEIQ